MSRTMDTAVTTIQRPLPDTAPHASTFVRGPEPVSVLDYLTARNPVPPLANCFLLLLIYQNAVQPHVHSQSILALLVLVCVAQWVGTPRWMVYVLLFAALALQTHFLTHILANGAQDATSSR